MNEEEITSENTLEHQLKTERIKSQILRLIIQKNTDIIIPSLETENLQELYLELKSIFSKDTTDMEISESAITEKKKRRIKPENEKITDIEIDALKESNISVDEAKNLFRECFERMRKERTYIKMTGLLKTGRLCILPLMTLEEYTSMLKDHVAKMTKIYSEKQLSEKIIAKHIASSLSTVDVRILFFYPAYMNTTLDIDELAKYKACLVNSLHFQNRLVEFNHDDFFKSFFNHGVTICTIRECIERSLFNPYNFYNVVYIHTPKSNDKDPFSFYYLKRFDYKTSKKYWIMDCRLVDLSNKLIDNVKPFLIDMFRKMYFDLFSDNEYRREYLLTAPKFELDFKQIVQNLCILSNPKKFNKYLRNIVKDRASYKNTDFDIRNFSTDDFALRRNFENEKEDIEPYENIKLLFDNISNDEAME